MYSNRQKANKRRYYLENRERILAQEKARQLRMDDITKEKVRNQRRKNYRKYDLKKHYNLTPDDWDNLFVDQRCRCAICGISDPGGHGHWNTDHDHSTGQVRGILCCACNITLGYARDDPKLLKAMAKYLEKSRG